jgi:hypothetical protein
VGSIYRNWFSNFPDWRNDCPKGSISFTLHKSGLRDRSGIVDPRAVAYESARESILVLRHFTCSLSMDQIFVGGKLSMRVKKSIKKFVGGGLVAFMCLIMAPAAMAAPVTGAIFTTDANGIFVNANVYDDMKDVYLNGGPRPNAPCTAAGLPDGDYYFQVTDPSGSVLLSTDDAVTARMVTVSKGIIIAAFTHATSKGQCGLADTTVQLFPYQPTPNPGGEYKVWVTPVSSYTPGAGSFGFLPKYSKTDNFKVIPPVDVCPDGTVFDPTTNACVVPPPLPGPQ